MPIKYGILITCILTAISPISYLIMLYGYSGMTYQHKNRFQAPTPIRMIATNPVQAGIIIAKSIPMPIENVTKPTTLFVNGVNIPPFSNLHVLLYAGDRRCALKELMRDKNIREDKTCKYKNIITEITQLALFY